MKPLPGILKTGYIKSCSEVPIVLDSSICGFQHSNFAESPTTL